MTATGFRSPHQYLARPTVAGVEYNSANPSFSHGGKVQSGMPDRTRWTYSWTAVGNVSAPAWLITMSVPIGSLLIEGGGGVRLVYKVRTPRADPERRV